MNTYSKTKIYLIFAGIGGVFLLFALLLLNQGMTVKRVSSEIENNWLPSILAVSSINTLTSDYRALEALHIMATDVEAKEKHAYAMQGVIDEITQAQSEYEPRISSDKERSIYQKFSKNYDGYLVASKQIITLSENNEAAKAALALKRSTTFFNTFSDGLWQ
jgi:methyl-accepting chemotaxis protein